MVKKVFDALQNPTTPINFDGLPSGAIFGLNVTIPNGQSVSPWVDLGGALLGGIILPAGWGATNPANLGFRRAQDDLGTGEALLFDVFGNRITIQPGSTSLAEARAYAVNPADFWHSRYLRLVALNQTTGATITVAADRVVRLLGRVP